MRLDFIEKLLSAMVYFKSDHFKSENGSTKVLEEAVTSLGNRTKDWEKYVTFQAEFSSRLDVTNEELRCERRQIMCI